MRWRACHRAVLQFRPGITTTVAGSILGAEVQVVPVPLRTNVPIELRVSLQLRARVGPAAQPRWDEREGLFLFKRPV
eukprot:1881204-Alexandrium_andersonii.AAC.1